MKSRRLVNDDWTFGQSLANYARDNEAILQDVKTRLRSFKNDWILDTNANIDWFSILGIKDNENIIIREVERVTLNTDGIIKINSIDLEYLEERKVIILINLDTIFTTENELKVNL